MSRRRANKTNPALQTLETLRRLRQEGGSRIQEYEVYMFKSRYFRVTYYCFRVTNLFQKDPRTRGHIR
jgi:hypothetical protein